MFSHFVSEISETYTFGSPETEFWQPEFEIDFCASNFASGHLKRETNTEYGDRLKAALWYRAGIEWDLSDFEHCDRIDPLSYKYIIFVSSDQLGDRRFVGKDPFQVRKRVMEGWLTGGKIFHAGKYFSGQVEGRPITGVTLPIGRTSSARRSESYHFKRATSQVRGCIRGFLEDKLRGSRTV